MKIIVWLHWMFNVLQFVDSCKSILYFQFVFNIVVLSSVITFVNNHFLKIFTLWVQLKAYSLQWNWFSYDFSCTIIDRHKQKKNNNLGDFAKIIFSPIKVLRSDSFDWWLNAMYHQHLSVDSISVILVCTTPTHLRKLINSNYIESADVVNLYSSYICSNLYLYPYRPKLSTNIYRVTQIPIQAS